MSNSAEVELTENNDVGDGFNDDEVEKGDFSTGYQGGQSLTWRNINMILNDKKGVEEKRILDNVWGEAKSGETTAIMGASGAGKTSLFNVLAGRASSKGKIAIDAEVYVGGSQVDPTDLTAIREKVGFVAQEDNLPMYSTVREAITFSARLRLPRSLSDEEINNLVEDIMSSLGLEKCADTLIGGGFKKGISGGEKKRTSVAIELITRPPIIMLDEPTSGLDSFSTVMVTDALEKLATGSNTTVIFTIHQPSVDVFYGFDKVILLNKGRVLYSGSTKSVVDDFAPTPFSVPDRYNPADWLLRIGSVETDDDLEKAGFYAKDNRGTLVTSTASPIKSDHRIGGSASLLTQISLLFEREWKNAIRNPLAIAINMVMTLFFALVFGLIFLGVGKEDRVDFLNVQAQLGAVVNVQVSTLFGQSQGALQTFPTERPLFLREYSTKHYNVLPYFLSKLITEFFQAGTAMLVQSLVCFFMIGLQMNFGQFFMISFVLALTGNAVALLLGSMSADPMVAMNLFPLIVVPQIFFSGVFLPIDLIPEFVRWGQYLCALKYASGLSIIYEFDYCEPGLAQQNCENILRRNDVNPDDAWWYWLALLGVFGLFRLMVLIVLRKKASVYA